MTGTTDVGLGLLLRNLEEVCGSLRSLREQEQRLVEERDDLVRDVVALHKPGYRPLVSITGLSREYLWRITTKPKTDDAA